MTLHGVTQRVLFSHSSFPSLVPHLIEFPHIILRIYIHTTGRFCATDAMADNRVNMDIYCKNCRETVLYCSNPARSLPEYGVLRCTVDGCFHQIAICTFCDKQFSIRGYDFRNIKNMFVITTTSCQE